MKLDKFKISLAILGGLLLVFIVLPILSIFVKQISSHPGQVAQTMMEFTTLKAVAVSIFAAFLSVLISFGFGVPLAYLLAREEFSGKGIVEGIIDLPMAIPHTVAGIALLTILGSGGFIGGNMEPLIQFEGEFLGIVIAMTFVSAPYLIKSAVEGFQSVDPKLENVARNLGASRRETFQKVSFPLAFPHIFNGAVMSWARAISEFSAIVLFVGFFPMIAPGLIWSRFYESGLSGALAVAFVLLIVILPIFIALRYIGGNLLDQD